jgi:hypothetical protein
MKSYSQHVSITCISIDCLDILLHGFLVLIITINLGTFNYDNNNYDDEVRKVTSSQKDVYLEKHSMKFVRSSL